MDGILVGSRAAARHVSSLEKRAQVGDADLWVLPGQSKTARLQRADVHETTKEIYDMLGGSGVAVSLNDLLTIKLSHLGYPNPKWWTHLEDVILFLEHRAKVNKPLLTLLREHWKKTKRQSPVSLAQTKADFFTDKVTYIYDHDDLHQWAAGSGAPMYTNCLKDGEQVMIDRRKFWAMPSTHQHRMFAEEIAVIAAERWLIPPNARGKYSMRRAWMLSLHKTLTSLTKGWASDFIADRLHYYLRPDFQLMRNVMDGACLTVRGEDRAIKQLEQLRENSNVNGLDRSSFASFVATLAKKGSFCSTLGDRYSLVRSTVSKGPWGFGEVVFRVDDTHYACTLCYAGRCGLDLDGCVETLRSVKLRKVTTTVYE